MSLRRLWTLELIGKVVGLTILFMALLSIDFAGLSLSTTVSRVPLQLGLVALADSVLLSYFATSSRWGGWREWGTVFALLYGTVYVLTSVEAVYLGSLLPASTVVRLLINGAITSSVFAGGLVWAFGAHVPSSAPSGRLLMPGKEWAWKIGASAGVYVLFFVLFGLVVYAPLGKAIDPTGYASEQAIASTAAGLVLPVELLRGALWSLLAIPAILDLPFAWRKTGVLVGLLLAVPLALTQFLATSMPVGLQVAHSFEILGENLAFGLALAWILQIHSRLPGRSKPHRHRGTV